MFNKEIILKFIKTATLIAFAFLTHSALASDITTLTKSLKPWQPLEITKSKDGLTVILDADQITPTIFDAVISSGACMDIWTHDVPAKYLESVKELRILNKHKAQGYVFEQPLNTCNEMGKETDDKAKVIMLSHTHLF